jgi:hypothetical protein
VSKKIAVSFVLLGHKSLASHHRNNSSHYLRNPSITIRKNPHFDQQEKTAKRHAIRLNPFSNNSGCKDR